MSKAWLRSGLGCAALLTVALSLVASTIHAEPRPGRKARAMNLFAGNLGRQFVNRFDCGLNAFGEVCVDPAGSTTVGGGYWPKGTPDQYVFNSGLQLAGIVDPGAGFAWASDTVGAFFFDPKGTTEHGDRLSLVWDSLDPTDLANWPRDAEVPDDPALFHPALWPLKTASQQDTWTQYWDGNPANNAGRRHPLGVLVTQRGMAWNFPTGNQDIIYFLYTFTNVTARNRAVYDALGVANADSLASLGARFQTLNEPTFAVQIPDNGYAITQLYAAFSMDADVSDAARENYSSAFLPFSMGTAFKGNWHAPEMLFPASVFGPPFTAAPGFVGVKYLKSPVVAGQEVGLTLFSNTINDGAFDDAQNTVQLWRYLSANLNTAAGDAPCNAPNPPAVGKVCYISQATDDVRFFQSSGPLTLAPGESQTIVVAYIAAAPVDHPSIAARGAGFDLKPTWPAVPDSLRTGTDTLLSIDRVMGAVSILPEINNNGRVDQNEIVTVPRSLLDKGLVAQGVYDARFLLPFPPDPVPFFLVPGPNQVTIVWRESPTEQLGDPYADVADDPPPSALYDPNYERFDVEGYRIYRGRTTGDLKLVAQFDKVGTVRRDFTAAFDYGNCAPELGFTPDCPAELTTTGVAHPLVGDVVQIPAGGRVLVLTAVGDTIVQVTEADTAVTGRASGKPPLRDTGVPFAFTDTLVRNGFQYFYLVTAFDVNSVASVEAGNTAIESGGVPKTITPRAASGQQTAGLLSPQVLIGADGSTLTGTTPTLDPATGRFSGPAQPTNGVSLGLAAFLPEVLDNGSVTLTIDSVVPGAALAGRPATYYVRAQGAGAPVPVQVQVPVDAFNSDASNGANFPATAITASKSTRYGGDATYSLYGSAKMEVSGTWLTASQGRADANSDPANASWNGPRWWTGATNETTDDPNGLQCHPAAGGCVQPDLSRNAGSLPGVGIFHHNSYLTVQNAPPRDFEGIGSTVFRAADMRVYWGASGAIDSVIDLTHKVPVPFSPKIRASWGILNDSSFILAGTNRATMPDTSLVELTWTDIYCVDPVPAYINQCGGTAQTPAVLQDHARLNQVHFTSSLFAGATGLTAGAPTGTGFIFYINGHSFLMQMAALPTAGTQWNVRFYSGTIVGAGPGNFVFEPAIRPPAVPGLRVQVPYQGSTFSADTTRAADLARIHTVPDPYYVTNAFEQSPNSKKLRFVNLPSRCIIRIYSLSGILVNVLTLDDATGGGEAEWNLRNRNEQFVASGVYFYHVETPDGRSKIGRFTVVNFAQ